MTDGERIKNARKKAGLTQKELGERLGISQSAIGQFEKPTSHLRLETLRKISKALNVYIGDLIGDWSIYSEEEIAQDTLDGMYDTTGAAKEAVGWDLVVGHLGSVSPPKRLTISDADGFLQAALTSALSIQESVAKLSKTISGKSEKLMQLSEDTPDYQIKREELLSDINQYDEELQSLCKSHSSIMNLIQKITDAQKEISE